MYLIGEDANGSLTPVSNMVKQNLKNWLANKRMLNDSVDLLDTVVLNYSINFSIIPEQNVNKFSALADAVNTLISYFADYLQEIGEPLSISEIFSILKNVTSVNDVVSVEIKNVVGSGYSDASVSVDNLLDPTGRMVRCPSNCIWELRNPSQNIFGTIA
jgi:hypothetical protein